MKKISPFFSMFVVAMLAVIFILPSIGSAEYKASMLKQEWQYGLFGWGIGTGGISVVDLDGDGEMEMVMGGSQSFWYVVKRTGPSNYEQVWISDIYMQGISRIAVADVDGDGIPEIFVGLSDGIVKVYDGRTFQEKGSFPTDGSSSSLPWDSKIAAMVVGDADGDGKQEVVISDGAGIYVYSATTYELKWSSPAHGGHDLAIGNVDNDPGPEIITTTGGGHGYVIDGVTHALKWDYVNGFGRIVKLGDLDGDGKQEIVAAWWNKITIFDADIKSPTWEITTSQDIDALAVADTDGDGIPEILYGDGQRGWIHCYDAVTKIERWAIDNPDDGVADIAVADVKGDGKAEVIWGAGAADSGPDHLYIADITTGQIEWQSMDISGPLSAVDVGDVDGDGQDDIVMVSYSSNSGYYSGVIHVFDAKTHDLKWRHILDSVDWMGVRSVKIGDVDDDGNGELVVTTANLYSGIIQVYDGKTGALKRQSAGYDGNYFTALAIGDVDGDGKTEIIAGQGIKTTAAPGAYLIVFDGATMEEKWKSVDLNLGQIGDIKLADIDNDGHVEIIVSGVSGLEGRVYIFDGITHQMKWAAALPAGAVAIDDVDGDGKKEILVGEDNGVVNKGVVKVYDGTTYALKGSYSLGTGNIMGLLVDDINGDGIKEWVVSDSSTFYVFNAVTMELLWKKGNLSDAALHNHIISRDVDNDGKKEIIFGAYHALYQFEDNTVNSIYSVSGSVKTVAGTAMAGTLVTLGGAVSATTTTDALGAYAFPGLAIGNYAVSPSKTGYAFSPLVRSVTVSATNVTGQNFTGTAKTYSISGLITLDGNPAPGITVNLSGTATATTTTDALGVYTFSGLANGAYNVTPLKAGVAFALSSRFVFISEANVNGQDFAGVTVYSISGTVKTAGGAAISGVTMTLSGASWGTTTTDTSGNYSFAGLANGSYTVTASKTGYMFTPTDRAVTVNGANLTSQDFTGATVYSVSGSVKTRGGVAISGVTMTLSGAASMTTTTDTGGNYSFAGLANGSYTITASKTGYTFIPTSRTVTVNGGNLTGQNFTCIAGSSTYSISGTITAAGSPLSGVAVVLSGSATMTVTTNASGIYTFSGLSNGSFTITPNKLGYTFTPPSRSVTVNGTNLNGQNFTATQGGGEGGTYSISGMVTAAGSPFPGVTITLSGAVSATTTTDVRGRYSFPGLANGSYSITPGKTGYTFTPAGRTVTISGASVTGQNFGASPTR